MNKWFRLLSAFLTVVILLFSLPLPFPVNAASLDDLSYTISNGEVTITGCDTSASGELVIPDTIEGYPVVCIGSEAFGSCSYLTGITVPDSVIDIESFAFAYCRNLEKILISNKITEIDRAMFLGCESLCEIVIPSSVTSIGDQSFQGCKKLAMITIPNSVKSIGISTFSECDSLVNITIPDSVSYMGSDVFYSCDNLTVVTLSDNLTEIGSCAFSYTNLEKIDIPDNVTSIGNNAFIGCNNLCEVTLPGVKEIEYAAFASCTSLSSITIGEQCKKIEGGAFRWCTSLKMIHFSGTPTQWCAVEKGEEAIPASTTVLCLSPDTLTYNANGGTNAPPSSQEYYPSVTISSQIPVREDYTFLGWSSSVNSKAEYQPGDTYSFKNGCTLFAVWSKECVVTFDANGGDGAPDAQTQSSFVPFQISDQTPTFPGVSNAFMVWCKGWSTERNGDIEYLPGGTYTIEDDITLYAVWHIRCSDCYGIGGHDVDCTDCGGTGNGEYCPNCMSNGWLGWETCGFCNGTCRITYDCPNCDGPYGYFWCTCDHGEINEYCGECTNGEVPILCPNCDGDGYFDCDSCSGDGIVFQPNSCVTCTGSGSVLYIPSVVTGDLNDDNSVNEDDAIYLLQHVLLPDIFTVSQNVDYNKDGTIDEDDAIYLLQHVLLPDLFPIS